MFIATLIAAERLSPGDLSVAMDAIRDCAPAAPRWLDPGEAADLFFATDPTTARAALEGLLPSVDVVVQREEGRAKRLLVADMDSTMITVECIDELADYAGIKAEVAAVTERAMRGELDFAAALDARVALLKGLDPAVLDRCYVERVQATPGAETLVRTMQARGARTVLVSGGFTAFADRVGAALGFDRVVANGLDLGAGTVPRPIVDAETKRAVLTGERESLGLSEAAVLAVGDGANDVSMIRVAGLGVAYRAKPVTAAAADARLDVAPLTALLHAQGWPRSDWIAL